MSAGMLMMWEKHDINAFSNICILMQLECVCVRVCCMLYAVSTYASCLCKLLTPLLLLLFNFVLALVQTVQTFTYKTQHQQENKK